MQRGARKGMQQISAGQDYGEVAMILLMGGRVAVWLVVLTAMVQAGKEYAINYSYIAGHLHDY